MICEPDNNSMCSPPCWLCKDCAYPVQNQNLDIYILNYIYYMRLTYSQRQESVNTKGLYQPS